MAVLVNFKICDNDKACSGMSACPMGVFSWDDDKGLIIDNSKCISCGKCEKACMVSAIRVAKTQEEYNKIKKEIKDDPRSINDLLVERFGGKPIDEAMIGTVSEIESKLSKAKRPLIIEFFNDDSIMCLLKSIPIKKIADAFDKNTRYRKIEISTQDALAKFSIQELPALFFYKDGKLVGRIEGYMSDEEEDDLIDKIKSFK